MDVLRQNKIKPSKKQKRNCQGKLDRHIVLEHKRKIGRSKQSILHVGN